MQCLRGDGSSVAVKDFIVSDDTISDFPHISQKKPMEPSRWNVFE